MFSGLMKPVAVGTTHHIKDTCLCLAAQRAARTLARRFDAAFRPFDLTSGQFSLLNALNRPVPPSAGAVAALLAIDRTTLTAALKPLVRRRLVAARRARTDARKCILVLTAKGRAALAEVVPVWRREHARLARDIVGVAALREGLDALVATSRLARAPRAPSPYSAPRAPRPRRPRRPRS